MKFTRGFRGRGPRDPRLPPGQYDVGSDWPVLTAEATPSLKTDSRPPDRRTPGRAVRPPSGTGAAGGQRNPVSRPG
jgi:hypothetical protein